MTSLDFKIIQNFLAHACGIILADNKQYLVENRLANLLAEFDITFDQLTQALQNNSLLSVKLKASVIDAMTTNETYWFRDDMQFSELTDKVLPELMEKNYGMINIWSSACSSGQEPYSISMCVNDMMQTFGKPCRIHILGTDISENILQQARSATYSELALARGLDEASKNRFFHPVSKGYQLNHEITKLVRFQQFNLLKPFASLGKFDIIFCRNVLIYFSNHVKSEILNRMADSLQMGGILFLSSTESMPSDINRFELVRGRRTRYYQKVN